MCLCCVTILLPQVVPCAAASCARVKQRLGSDGMRHHRRMHSCSRKPGIYKNKVVSDINKRDDDGRFG